MLRTIRNLIVNIMAAFIRDKDARHKFRNKYKIRSKFRKLRDDNRRLFIEHKRLFIENKRLFKENKTIIDKLSSLQNNLRENRITSLGWPPIIKRLEEVTITPQNKTDPVYLSIACIAKNEGPYIKEWIEYHKIVGVERFYFYDNESEDNTKDILEPYINDGTVVYHYVEGVVKQLPVYHDAVLRYSNQSYWIALIDLDEYIVPKEKDTVSDFLKDFEKYPGVVVNWVVFDSNGYDTKPTQHGGLVTANFTRVRDGYNKWYGTRTIKSIVHPSYVIKFINPHQATYKGDIFPVSENFEPVAGPGNTYCSINKIQLNHYYCKSREEYLKKIERGRSDSTRARVFNEQLLNFDATDNDYAIQKYLPKLKIAMGVTN